VKLAGGGGEKLPKPSAKPAPAKSKPAKSKVVKGEQTAIAEVK
jgi:hypothetical protein